MSRLDWCRAGAANDYDGLSCVLRARMCAAHIEASGNEAWAAGATPQFNELLSAANVQKWTSCPEAEVGGTCGLLMTRRYGPPLWNALGHEREKALYERILNGEGAATLPAAPVKLPNCEHS